MNTNIRWINFIALRGFIAGISPILLQVVTGIELYHAGRNFGEWLVIAAQVINRYQIVYSLIFGILLIASYSMGRLGRGNRFTVFLQSFALAQLLLYFALDTLFFRGAMIIYLFSIGSVLLFSVFISLGYKLRKNDDLQKTRLNLNNIYMNLKFKDGVFAILAILLMAQFFPALLMIAPQLPENNNPQALFDVKRTEYVQDVNPKFLDFIEPEYPNNVWKTYLYMPLDISESVPIYIFIHGHTGSNTKYYDSILRTISSRGVLVIFIQYSSYYDESRYMNFLNSEGIEINSSEIIANYYRYNQVLDALDEFFQLSNISGSKVDDALEPLPFGYDTDRIMIGGHSLGGGMAVFISEKMALRGYGSTRFVIDIEAGWVSSFSSNLSALPDNTIISVVVYSDDVVVPACISANYFEKMKERGNKASLPDSQTSYIVVQSDFYGYPRDLANHYSPTDLIQYNIYNSLLVRMTSMADYLIDGVSLDFLTNTDMGKWSDGTPFNPMIISSDPLGVRGGESIEQYVSAFESEYCP